jgi:outer membrane protein W
MRKTIVVAVWLLFIVTSAFAQQSSRSNAVSVFVSDLSIGSSSASGAKLDSSAYGASFDHKFTDRFSAEVSVSSQRSRRVVRTFGPGSAPTFGVDSTRLYPIDANVTYHLPTHSRWKPYIGAGLRYVNDTFQGYQGLGRTAFYRNAVHTIDPEISGGITLQFNRTLGLRLDAKQVLGSNRSDVADPELKASAGLSFRF